MADPDSQLDPGPLDASTNLEKRKDVEDSISSPSLPKITNSFKSFKQKSKVDYSGNPKEATEVPRKLFRPSFAHDFQKDLKKLDLSGRGLTGLPPDLFENCYEIEELNLSNNPLAHSDLYPIGCMHSLKKLDVSGCGLKELNLSFLQMCDEIEELNLSNNSLTDLDLHPIGRMHSLKKLDLSGCSLRECPSDLENSANLQELNLSNNLFDHQDLLEELNSETKFSFSERELFGLRGSSIDSSIPTRIIFEDAIYIKSGGVWTMKGREVWTKTAREDTAPKEESWLDEFCRIRRSEKFTIETYHSMLESMKILATLVGDNEKILNLKSCCFKIQRYLDNIKVKNSDPDWDRHHYIPSAIFYLKKAVSGLINGTIDLKQAMAECAKAFKEALEAFSHGLSTKDGLLVAELKIISKMMSKLGKPEAAIPCSLQSLLELHDLHAVRKVFSYLDEEKTDNSVNMLFAKAVFKINKVLFEFVQLSIKPPPTVEEWPVTIQLLDKSIRNPLIDKRLMDTEKVVPRETKLDICEVDNSIQNPSTDVAGYSFMITESCGQTPDISITVDQKGGCFSLPDVCAFLLFPPNAVDEKVTLKCCRVKHKDCKVKLSNGEVFVSRILKIEPEGVTFKKPVTVLLSHSLDEDQENLCFYELIVKNLNPTGCHELKTEAISSIEDVPKEICNKEVLNNYLPLAKATIQETCTLAAATRARFHQILIPTNRRYVFCKRYGGIAELKITFPAGVTKEILSLKVQLFPADAVVNKGIRLNKNLVCAPVIRLSGQKTSFLKAVDVELTYSHSDAANIKEEFLPVEKTIQFTTEYGLLLRNHNETESQPNWQALNKSNNVSIERSRKDQLKFSFSVRHFSDVQPVVKTNSFSYVPRTNSGMVDMNNPGIHHGIVLAVHDIHSSSSTLHAVLAPKLEENRLHEKWKTKGCRFMSRLKYDEPIYFCVPMSDTAESEHLSLKDYTLRFDPEDASELPNSVDDDVNLQEKDMRFLKDRECNNGENHTTQGDCRAKVPIYISESRSVQETSSSESHQFMLDSESPQGQEDVQTDGNKVNEVVMCRCKLFEKTVEIAARKKLGINKAFVEVPKGSKATEFMEIAGPTATIIFSLAAGITIAVSVATYGAASFAAALVAGATLLVKSVDKHLKQAHAKVVENAIAMTDETKNMSSYINCIVKEVARELSRIFEFQLFQLQNNEQVEILAQCAVDLMLDLKKHDKFDRNTLLKKVLQDGNIKKRGILTRMEDVVWSAPNVFRKPGLRRQIIGKNGGEFKYFIKPKGACKTGIYGYRGQFLEVKKYVCQIGEYETAPMDEPPPMDETPTMDGTPPMDETPTMDGTPTMDETPTMDGTPTMDETTPFDEALPIGYCGVSCKECSPNGENWPMTSEYFSESALDSQFTESRDESLTYHPVHILIQCPEILNSFQQLQGKNPSLAMFLKTKFCLSEHHLVCPVYRPHSPGKVPDLQNSDLSRSDFSRCNFTGSRLENCNFTKCVMLFTKLTGAKMSDSKFCDTYIHNSNLEKVEAYRCEWTKTSLLYSLVDGAHMDTIGGNCLEGTDVSKMNKNNGFKRKRNCDNKQARAKMLRLSKTCDGQAAGEYARTRPQPSDLSRDPDAPSTSRVITFHQDVLTQDLGEISFYENQARAKMFRPGLSETSEVQDCHYTRTRPQPSRMDTDPDAPSTSRETTFYQNSFTENVEMNFDESEYN